MLVRMSAAVAFATIGNVGVEDTDIRPTSFQTVVDTTHFEDNTISHAIIQQLSFLFQLPSHHPVIVFH